MKIHLWSSNYDPEPLGVAPISAAWARSMLARGHDVKVVAAHPHYPKPDWGTKVLPYREIRDGVPVTRLPLVAGRDTAARRILQEISFTASQTAASPFLGTPDALVAVSPSFPALLPAILNSRARSAPLIIWLQDILPDGAATTGYVGDGSRIYRWSRKLEDAAYRHASRIVVLSESFRLNLIEKGVPDSKIVIAYNPATIEITNRHLTQTVEGEPPRVICMGNIGKSQKLPDIVRSFEAHPGLGEIGARLIITGSGVAEGEVRSAIRTDRVSMTGLLSQDDLERELSRASLAAVSQSYEEEEFNVPSKLMNYLAAGLPVVGSVTPRSEAARIIEKSHSGWVAQSGSFGETVFAALSDDQALEHKAASGQEFAKQNLSPESLADRFESVIGQAIRENA